MSRQPTDRRPGKAAPRLLAAVVAFLPIAGTAALTAPPAVAASTGTISTIAGTGVAGHDGDGSAATTATLDAPNDAVVGPAGNLFVGDWSAHVVRMIARQDCAEGSTCPFGLPTTAGDIYTVAGDGTAGDSGDAGPAAQAQLEQPAHLAFDQDNNLLIADLEANVVRMVAGSTCAEGCWGISATTVGNIYTIVGDGTAGFAGDGFAAADAQLNSPRGLAVAGTAGGTLYLADYGNNRIRAVNAGNISTVAGTGATGFDNGAAATAATFDGPIAVTVSRGTGETVYVSDANNHAIRAITAGTVSTIAGTGTGGYAGDGGPATAAHLFYPDGITTDAHGNLFVADYHNGVVREIAGAEATNGMTAGDIYTVAGTGTAGYAGDGGTATAAQLHGPSGVAVDDAGDLFVADTANHVVRQIDGDINTYAGFVSIDPAPAVPAYRDTVLATSPLRYYRFGEAVGSTRAFNSAGAGDGTFAGTYQPAATLGQPGPIRSDSTDTAITGDGSGALLTGSDTGLPAGNTARTIEAWFNLPVDTTGINVLVEYGTPSGCGSTIEIAVYGDGKLINNNYNCGGTSWTAPVNLHDGHWHHLAMVIDGSGAQTMYLDGATLGTQTVTLNTQLGGATALIVGDGFDQPPLTGSIDEVAIYPTALSAEQIAAHVAAAAVPKTVTTTSVGSSVNPPQPAPPCS